MSEHDPISETRAMIAGMSPTLDSNVYLFCTTTDPAAIERGKSLALSWFEEAEGTSLIISQVHSEMLAVEVSTPMSRIELQVFSSLDGIGSSAAVASALAASGIACNMVSAYHHDHVFVPTDRAEEAVRVLRRLSSTSQ